MPGVRLMSQKRAQTARLMPSARTLTSTEARAPKRLQIMSMQRKLTQLTLTPQSSASHGSDTSSLLASRFITTTLTTKSATVALGMLRSRTL